MAKGNPHLEEQDGSDHGNTGKPPRDHEDNGKSCEVHGNHGGVNEDHCDTTTITTTPDPTPTTTTTVSQPTTTTTLTPEPPVSTTTTTTFEPDAPPATDTPLDEWPRENTVCTTTDGHQFVTSYEECPPLKSSPPSTTQTTSSPTSTPSELAATGVNSDVLGGLGLALVAVGVAIKLAVRR